MNVILLDSQHLLLSSLFVFILIKYTSDTFCKVIKCHESKSLVCLVHHCNTECVKTCPVHNSYSIHICEKEGRTRYEVGKHGAREAGGSLNAQHNDWHII